MKNKLSVSLAAAAVMLAASFNGFADTFYMSDGLADVYALDVREGIKWRHVGKVGYPNKLITLKTAVERD